MVARDYSWPSYCSHSGCNFYSEPSGSASNRKKVRMTATLTLDAPIQPRIESPTVVSVQGLDVSFTDASRRKREVVQKISFDLRAGECLAIVGESGSGKSVTARTLVGLTGAGAEVTAEQLQINGQGVRSLTQRQWRELRGNKIGFVSQDALVALDPFQKVGSEVGQALKIHTELEPKQRQKRVLATLRSEEHTSELQSRGHLVCRLLLEKKK